MQESTPQSETNLTVSNPLQAASEIFYHPRAVFNALSVKDNWSWIPFILVLAVSAVPVYLHFNIVDFEWYRVALATMQSPEGSPAEIEALSNNITFGMTQLITLLSIALGVPIFMVLLAGYFTLWTRNDEKSIHGFTDWYGATWWMAMPSIINALLACLYLMTQEAGTEISQSALAPLSVAFAFGTEMTDKWYGMLSSIRLDTFWTMMLAAICLNSWTNFSMTKAIVVAAIPNTLIWTLTFLYLM
ncbi:YIP1 family protein [Glaciecola sp. SC05]|uniref:YIP1 family protein n=1 Tax=Glaciecola sp. SC05 TaxID=1987355 RepID=UPI003528088A